MQKINIGDTVLIVKNKDRGKKGKVIKVIPKELFVQRDIEH